jgi:hypothetical protein
LFLPNCGDRHGKAEPRRSGDCCRRRQPSQFEPGRRHNGSTSAFHRGAGPSPLPSLSRRRQGAP